MKKELLSLALCALLPLGPLLFLYNQNAEYVSGGQVLLVGAMMIAVSLVGYGVLRGLFRSRASGALGCLCAWLVFFGYNQVYAFAVAGRKLLSPMTFIAAYACAGLLLIFLVALLARKLRFDKAPAALLLFAAALVAMNAVPAAKSMLLDRREAASFDAAALKREFYVDETSKTPNVYWIHLDGMLGFDAYERYFGDDQAELTQALAEMGFQINRGATLEAAHTTQLAVAQLMCPDFYDREMVPRMQTHEDAMALRGDLAFKKGPLQQARIYNELVLAFAQRGYFTQTLARHNIYFTPLVDRAYDTYPYAKASITRYAGNEDQIVEQYLNSVKMDELATLLVEKVGSYFARGMLKRAPLEKRIDEAQLKEILLQTGGREDTVNLVSALYDALDAPAPSLSVLHMVLPHYPFSFDAEGNAAGTDPNDILSYGPHHVYTGKVLLNMLRMILASDPDAVIALQADHGLHGQSAEEIAAAFGPDAVLPIWNGVFSALRVPETYQTGEEALALSDPLNLARYLVNAFVGENYQYR